MSDRSKENKYFSGPLNLYRETKSADTVMGTELTLDEKEFNALDMLVAREGEPITFEQLYEAVWEDPDYADGRDAARAAMWNLIEQVSSAGKGFMRIEYTPEVGYTFRTHWGHNWQAERVYDQIDERLDEYEDTFKPERERERERERRKVDVGSFILTASRHKLPYATPKRDGKLLAALLSGVAIAAAAIVIVFSTLFNELSADTRTIEEAQVPLALASNKPQEEPSSIGLEEGDGAADGEEAGPAEGLEEEAMDEEESLGEEAIGEEAIGEEDLDEEALDEEALDEEALDEEDPDGTDAE